MSVSQFPVNRYPTALLRFLGLTGPDAPNRLSEMIGGTVDLLDWWVEANAVQATSLVTPGVGVTGFVVPATPVVPLTQRWIVTEFLVGSAVIAAAHTYEAAACYRRVNPSNVYVLGQSQVGVVGGVLGIDAFAGNRRWLLLAPGENLGAYMHQNTGAAPAQLTLNYRYASFPA